MRLSESGRHRVLLLEAETDDRWIWLKVPLGAGRVLLSERGLWRFFTEPEPHMAARRMFWPRGRVLGGSSTIKPHPEKTVGAEKPRTARVLAPQDGHLVPEGDERRRHCNH